jgi:hypothetical protein
MLTTSALLATGTALFLIAQWRGWRPSLRTALAVGIALRVAVWILATVNSWQPFDFADDFSAAASAVLHHQDPLLTGRTGGWHFLPPMAFVFAGELWFCYAANLPWQLVGRLAPVLADLALIPLVGRLARDRGRLRSFQYACNPLSIMICAIHGQIEPEMLAFGVAAFVVARSRFGRASGGEEGPPRAGSAQQGGGGTGGARGAGILLGLSIAMGTWSVLLLPGLLKSLPGRVRRVHVAAWAAFVPAVFLITSPLTVGTPIGKLPAVVSTLIGAQPVVGDWGWTAIAAHGNQVVSATLARPGMLILAVALLAVGCLWRRADPIDLTVALLMTFLIFTPRFGDQYLMWPLPFLIARKTRFGTQAVLLASVWVGIGEVYIGSMSPVAWQHAHHWWAYGSLAVVGSLLLALAGISRRQPEPGQRPVAGVPAGTQPAPGQREPVAVPARSHPVPGQRLRAPALTGPPKDAPSAWALPDGSPAAASGSLRARDVPST